jgi:hypothetical protein
MRLGDLIRVGGLTLALAAGGSLAGCDDEEPMMKPLPDAAVVVDAGADAAATDAAPTDAPPAGDAAAAEAAPGADAPGTDAAATDAVGLGDALPVDVALPADAA